MIEIKLKLPKPHPGQHQVLNSQKRWRVLQCGRRWGKSLVAKISVIQEMLDGNQTAYITPTFSLGKLFYQEVLKMVPKVLVKSSNKSDLEITLVTGGTLKFFTGENLDALRGRKFHFIVVDEAAFIQDLEGAWNNSIRATLTDYKGRCLFISTPRGKNYFHSLYLKGMNQEHDFESFHFTSYDNTYIDPAELDDARMLLTDAAFKQEYLAEPGENISNPFSGDSIRNGTLKVLSNKPPVVFGVDVARTTDFTVLIGLDEDGAMCYFQRFQLPWINTMERIKQLPSNVPKYMDATGVGSVLFEQLQQQCHQLHAFTFTMKTKPSLVMELVKAVEAGTVKFNDVTANELSVFEYKITSTGHIKYQAQSGFHDDCVMALALANKYKERAIISQSWKLYSC